MCQRTKLSGSYALASLEVDTVCDVGRQVGGRGEVFVEGYSAEEFLGLLGRVVGQEFQHFVFAFKTIPWTF